MNKKLKKYKIDISLIIEQSRVRIPTSGYIRNFFGIMDFTISLIFNTKLLIERKGITGDARYNMSSKYLVEDEYSN